MYCMASQDRFPQGTIHMCKASKVNLHACQIDQHTGQTCADMSHCTAVLCHECRYSACIAGVLSDGFNVAMLGGLRPYLHILHMLSG